MQPLTCAIGPAVQLAYVSPERFATARPALESHLLGAVAFGARPADPTPAGCPYAWVDMPVLGAGATVLEVWTAVGPVLCERANGIAASRTGDILFGLVEIEEEASLDAASYLAYQRIFEFIDQRGYGHLLRMWNYFPGINSEADGLERYRRFCRGRHDAFVDARRTIDNDAPAACALGSRSGPLVVYFLAAREAGRRVENPRQLSAYRYPGRYGPRSPTFSRAMLAPGGAGAPLYISGTAGIVGHETQHVGDPAGQARETAANLLAVVEEAKRAGLRANAGGGTLTAKAYLRRADCLPAVRAALEATFGPNNVAAIYLQADICRSDLLLEVEAVYGQIASGFSPVSAETYG